jgi:flagellar basal body-associated protein FliL
MKKSSILIIILAIVVIVVAGYAVYRSTGGTSAVREPIHSPSPKDKDPNFDPMENAPPGLAGVGGGG